MPRNFIKSLRVKRDIIPRSDLSLDIGDEVWGNFPDDFPPVLAAGTLAGPYEQRLQRGDRVGNTVTRPVSPSTFRTDQVLVAAGGTLIVPANPDRISCLITNSGAATVFIGTATAPGTVHSHIIPAGASFSFAYVGALYGDVAGASQTVSYAEESL